MKSKKYDSQKKYRILIADDHQMMIEGWMSLLEKEDKFKVVGTVTSGKEVLSYLKSNQVDLIILDIDMGHVSDDGLIALAEIRKQYGNQLNVLIVSMHDEIGYIQEAMELGTDGYIFKSSSTDEMLEAMHKICDGHTFFSQDVMAKVAKKMRIAGEMPGIQLTKREKKVLPLLCQGLSAKEVGQQLFISHNTVNTFKKQLFIKFEVNKIQELMIKARELGFIK
ncbi:MAG: response regulator transcription factor [Fulvivirga sp.]|uniref:response regulator transcription factor n=1 Tax=Fulvivirga sp. TaxID=1931237 RepID=UPI0032EE17DB